MRTPRLGWSLTPLTLEDDWDARNLLYSLRFNIGTAILIPGCNQRQVVLDDVTELCKMFCPEDLISKEESDGSVEEEEPEEPEEMDENWAEV